MLLELLEKDQVMIKVRREGRQSAPWERLLPLLTPSLVSTELIAFLVVQDVG